MSAPAAIKATFSDFKLVRGRKVAQLVLEVPLEAADQALSALGGLPNPASETWVALARLDPNAKPDAQPPAAPKERRRFNAMLPAQQAALRCKDEAFQRFMHEEGHSPSMAEDDVTAAVRNYCGVISRSELATQPTAQARWSDLRDMFEAWMQVAA